MLRGIRERVFAVEVDGELRPPPKPSAGVFESRLASFRGKLLRCIIVPLPWTHEQFVASYVGAKRRIYEAAVVSLRTVAVSIRDSWVKAFGKAEKLNLSKKSDPASRIISPRSARFNVMLGVFLRPAEAAICRAIAVLFGGPTVMKGYNALQVAGHLRGMWDEFAHPIAIGLDASRFDQHVSTQALAWEHSVYLWMFRQGPNSMLARLLRWQLCNKVFCYTPEGSIKYEVRGTRMSGDMNTSLGNCLLMCAMVHAYAEYVGVRVRLANNGDDCVVFCTAKDELRFTTGLQAWFLEMGFTMKVEPTVHVFEQVEFCQARPVEVDGVWTMCRSPFSGLAKDSICLRPEVGKNMVRSFKRWAFGVGSAGTALASGMPVLQAAYQRMVAEGEPPKVGREIQGLTGHSGLLIGARGMVARVRTPAPSTRYSFWLAWGITPDEQEAIEAQFLNHDEPTTTTVEVSYQLATLIPLLD